MRPTIEKTKNGLISLKGKMCDVSTSSSEIKLLENSWIKIDPTSLRLAPECFEELSELLESSPKKYELYTDGSAVPNPGRGGWAAVLYCNNKEEGNVQGNNPKCGNGKMELMAVAKGLSLIPFGETATIWIDSKYVLETIGKGLCPPEGPKGWIEGWRKRSWIKKDGEAVKNLKEVKMLYEALMGHCKEGSSLTFEWVKSHSGVEGNERADQLANQARET